MNKEVGKIVNTHGIRGELRILSNSDFKDVRFAKGSKLTAKGRRFEEIIEIESHYTHKNFDIVKLVGYTNINEVEKFKNCMLYGPELDESVLGDGEYFIDQIVGLNVVDQDGNKIGVVKSLNTQSYQKLLIIKTEDKDAMVPYVDHFVLDINLDTNTMTINNMPGLIDEN